jgi:hypothetical protein
MIAALLLNCFSKYSTGSALVDAFLFMVEGLGFNSYIFVNMYKYANINQLTSFQAGNCAINSNGS